MPTLQEANTLYIRKTSSKGQTYYRVVECRWIEGRPRQVNLVSLGPFPLVAEAIQDRKERAAKLSRRITKLRSRYRTPELLALAPAFDRRELEAKVIAVERINGEVALLEKLAPDIPPLIEVMYGGDDPLVPTDFRSLPVVPRSFFESIRARLAPDCWSRFDDSVAFYFEALEGLREFNDYDYDPDHQNVIRVTVEDVLRTGGPESVRPCPHCADESGISWGHDRSHPSWPNRCPHCSWHGFVGLGWPLASANDAASV